MVRRGPRDVELAPSVGGRSGRAAASRRGAAEACAAATAPVVAHGEKIACPRRSYASGSAAAGADLADAVACQEHCLLWCAGGGAFECEGVFEAVPPPSPRRE